jgi:hypothetical protein
MLRVPNDTRRMPPPRPSYTRIFGGLLLFGMLVGVLATWAHHGNIWADPSPVWQVESDQHRDSNN